MEERLAKIISDLELSLATYPSLPDASSREVLRIAYAYRLSQLELYGSREQYVQFSSLYVKMTGGAL